MTHAGGRPPELPLLAELLGCTYAQARKIGVVEAKRLLRMDPSSRALVMGWGSSTWQSKKPVVSVDKDKMIELAFKRRWA
jgi:hypothetical protein